MSSSLIAENLKRTKRYTLRFMYTVGTVLFVVYLFSGVYSIANNEVGRFTHATPRRNVAAANPEVVKQLLDYAEKARADLGDVGRPGQGQRQAGWVEVASPRLLAK